MYIGINCFIVISIERGERNGKQLKNCRKHPEHRASRQTSLGDHRSSEEQWMVLGRLYRNSGEYNQKELAKELNKEQPSMTRIIDILAKKKYVTRERSNQDRREFIIHITGKGKDFYEETLPAAITAQKEIKAVISSKESDQIMKILKKMEKGLERELE